MDYNKLIEKALEAGIKEIEVYASSSKNVSISLYESNLDQYKISDTNSLSVRGVYNDKMGNVSVENLSDDKIDFIIESIIDSAKTISSTEPYVIYEGSKSYPTVVEKECDFDKFTTSQKIDLLKNLEKKIKESSELIAKVSNIGYSEVTEKTQIINSKGLDLEKNEKIAYIYGYAVAKDGDSVNNGGEVKFFHKIEEVNLDEIANKIKKKSVDGLNAKSVKSGKYRVMLTNEITATFLNAFSSVFSGEAVIKNMSLLKDKVDTQIFGKNITIVDNPLDSRAIFSSPFDDEGVACYKKTVVEKGVLKLFLQNLSTAKSMNVEPTGNGFKVGGKIGVFANNMYLEPGEKSYDEMVKALGDGIIINSVAGVHAGVNEVSGDLSLQASGMVVVDGAVSHAVTLFVVAGNIMTLFNNVSEIGSDLEFSDDGFGAPSIIIDDVMISGD